MRLLDQALPVDWLPSETLYSLLSRFHRISGHGRSFDTSKVLFQSPCQGGSATIVTHLSALDRSVGGQLGTVAQLLYARQIAGFFRVLLSPADEDLVLKTASQGASAKRLRAMLNCAIPANELRYCPACALSDRSTHGAAFWHLEHQLPCVYACVAHEERLLVTESQGSSSWLQRWVLPPPNVSPSEGRCTPALLSLARIAADIQAHSSELRINAASVLQRLHDSPPARTRFEQTLASLESDLQSRLPRDRSSGIQRNRVRLDVNLLPIVVHVLGGSLNEFTGLRHDAADARHRGSGVALPRKRPEQRAKVLELVRAGTAVSTAARQVSVDVKTAQTWVARELGAVPRRPSQMRGATEKLISELARRGAEKGLIARETGLSPASITSFILTRPQLDTERRQIQTEIMLSEAKARLSRVVSVLPSATNQVCRALEPGAYALLYRRDRVWLQSFGEGRPAVRPRKSTGANPVDLAASIDKLAQSLTSPTARVSEIDVLVLSAELLAQVDQIARCSPLLRRLRAVRASARVGQIELF